MTDSMTVEEFNTKYSATPAGGSHWNDFVSSLEGNVPALAPIDEGAILKNRRAAVYHAAKTRGLKIRTVAADGNLWVLLTPGTEAGGSMSDMPEAQP